MITTTELRTRSKELVKTLKEGGSVDLIHRSKIIGVFKPIEETKKPLTLAQLKELEALLTSIRPKKLVPRKERNKVYRSNLEKNYGKRIS